MVRRHRFASSKQLNMLHARVKTDMDKRHLTGEDMGLIEVPIKWVMSGARRCK